MSRKIPLTLACGDYEIVRALKEGEVEPDGIDLTVLTAMDSTTRHWRFLRNRDFDMAEVSASSYIVSRDQGFPFRALPVFLHRRFRHGFVFINTGKGIAKPQDLIGRKIGVKSFLVTAVHWLRGILEHEYGVPHKSIHWHCELDEDIDFAPPPDVRITRLPHDKSVEDMLAEGELDALLHSDLIKPYLAGDPRVARLFPDYKREEIAYFRKTGIFPIMHVMGIKEEIVARYPWVPINMFQAFERAKAIGMKRAGEPAPRAARLVSRGLGRAGGDPRPRSLGIRARRAEPQDAGNARRLFLRAGPDQAADAARRAVHRRVPGPQARRRVPHLTPPMLGESVPRLEDPALLRGRARFVDDIHLPGMLEAAFVRSPHAHALIRGIDKSAALAAPGVRAVLTLDDLRPHLRTERLAVGLPSPSYKQQRDRPVLAAGEAVHVGEAVAIVVADTRARAEDAAALVDVQYELLPPVADCRAALAPGAPVAHSGAAHNLLASFVMAYGDVERAFAAAPHRFALSLWQHRGGGHSLEGRGAVAQLDPLDGRLTLWNSTQTPHAARRLLSDILGCDESRIRVVTPDVGGGFGPKLVFYPEDAAVALAAILLRRPVKWIEDRREHFCATTQERDQYWDVEIAVDAQARILGLRGTLLHDHGAYTARGVNLPYESAQTVTLPYDVPAYRMEVRLALTNKVPVSPVRGAGQPQGVFAMERLLDAVARGMGLDRAEVRRRNLVGPERMPCAKPLVARGGLAVVLDSGDYPRCQEMVLARADWADFPARQQAARREGRYLGIGLANFVKGTGRGPFESVAVRIGPSGKVQVEYRRGGDGAGHAAPCWRRSSAPRSAVAPGDIAVTAGDTAAVALGIGGFNSRQAVLAGTSAHQAALAVRAQGARDRARICSRPPLPISRSRTARCGSRPRRR